MVCLKKWIKTMFPQRDKNGQGRNYTVAKIFIDTNIFVYTLDKYDKTKQKTTRKTVKNIRLVQ
jgi:hypothetical protein